MSNWNLSYLLTDLIGTRANSVGEVRNEIWASDLGGIMLDRYLDMKGTPYSDLPDGRGLANFFLGEQIESGLKTMLENLGIAYTDNERKLYQEKDYLPVVAKPDLIVEITDWEQVRQNLLKEKEKINELEEKYRARETQKLEKKFEVLNNFRKRFGNYFAYTKIVIHLFGGERGIRTPDTTFQSYNGLANRRLQPLGHLSLLTLVSI